MMPPPWRKRSVLAYLDALASGRPTPGGGSAAALAAACGIGLLSMAGQISGVPPAVVSRLRQLRRRVTAMIDRDTVAYEQFVRALRAFRGCPDPLRYRRLQRALREAVLVPLEVRHTCDEASQTVEMIERSARRWLASDIGLAKGLLATAKRAAKALVRANLAVVREPGIRRLVRRVHREKG